MPTQETTEQLVDGWDDDSIIIHKDDLPKHILDAIGSQIDVLKDVIEEIYVNIFIDSAEDDELNRIGRQVGIRRRNNEGDDDLRKRIRLAYAAATSETTYDDFERTVVNLFDSKDFSIEIADDGPTIVINTTFDVYDGAPAAEDDVIDLLSRTLQSNHGVEINADGTFELAGYTNGDKIIEHTTVDEPTTFAQPLTLEATLTMNATTTLENKTYVPPDGTGLNEGTLGVHLRS